MKKNNLETENARLQDALKHAQKKNKSLAGKLATAKAGKTRLRKELKKKGARNVELSNEQLQSLSSRLKGIDIRSLLFD